MLGFALTFVLFIEPPVVSDSSSVELCKHDTPFFRTARCEISAGFGAGTPQQDHFGNADALKK